MLKIIISRLSVIRQNTGLLFLSFCSIFAFPSLINAQVQFSKEDLPLIKQRKLHPDFSRYNQTSELQPLAKANLNNKVGLAEGNLDPTFNASVSEGSGFVDDIAVLSDGSMIVTGDFDRVGVVNINSIALLNADGSLNPAFNPGAGPNANIRALAVQPDGKILIGGNFTSYAGQTRTRLARLNPLGDLDTSFTPINLNGAVNDILVLSDGRIMVGGNFSVSSSRLVVLNIDGTLSSAIPGFSSQLFKIALQPDGKIVVAGSGTQFRRLNADFSVDATFNSGTGPNDIVFDMTLQPDGKILLGGYFTFYNGTNTDQIVRVNADGTLDTTFEFLNDTDIQNSEVDAIAVQPDGKILASNLFANETGNVGRIVRFNANGTLDATFTTGNLDDAFANEIKVLSDGKFLVGGAFVSYNNQTRLHIAKLDGNGGFDNAFNSSISTTGIVYAVKHQADGKILIAGDFEFVNGVRKPALARLNRDGSLDDTLALPSSFFGDVYALDIQLDGKIIIGGLFAGADNFPGYAAARVNSDGSFDAELNNSSRFSTVAYAVGLQSNGGIIVAGQILGASLGNYAANRFNANGSFDETFNPAILPSTSLVRALVIQPNDKIVFGGTFTPSVEFPRGGIARLNANGAFDNTFTTSLSSVFALKQTSGGQIYAGGASLTRMSSEGAVDTTLNIGTGFNSTIRAIEVQPDGKILIGGFFTAYNGSGAFHFIRINPNGSRDPGFTAGTNGFIFALHLQTDGKILAGGQFYDFNGAEKLSIVRLTNAGKAAPYDFDGDGKTDIGIFRPTDGSWWYSRSSDSAFRVFSFGASTDVITPGDFTGDGKADIAVFRPSTGEWFVQRSEDNSFFSFPFGASGDVPVPADFDGDGKTDAAVFRPATAEWFILNSSGTGTSIVTFGTAEDKPVPADFDGDGKTDIAIFRPSDGSWWYLRSSDSQFRVFRFGLGTDKPVQGDYTGDGKADIAVFRPSSGEWYFQRSEDNSYYSVPFGASGDIAAPGDYDGDGKFDTAVFRPATANWFIQRSTAGILIASFGASGDRPIPNAFVP